MGIRPYHQLINASSIHYHIRYGFIIVFILNIVVLTRGQPESPETIFLKKAEDFKFRNQFDSALFYYKEFGRMISQEYRWKDAILNDLNIIDLYISKKDLSSAASALALLDNALPPAYSDDPLIRSEVLQVKGAYHISTGNLDVAEHDLMESIGTREGRYGRNDTLLRYAYNKLGNLFIAAGDYAKAFSFHENALRLSLLKKNPDNFLAASSFQNLAIAAHLEGEYALAEQLFQNALSLNEKLFSDTDPALASVYINIGKFYIDISRFDSAINYFDKADNVLANYDSQGYADTKASILWNKGNILIHQGDYEKAINYLTKTYTIYYDFIPRNEITLMRIQLDIGLAYDLIGNIDEALKHYLSVVFVSDNPYKVKLFRNIAKLYAKKSALDSANYYYLKAIKNANKFSTIDNFDLGLCYQYYGENLSSYNRDSAIYFLKKSLNIFINLFGEQNRDVARVKLRLGELYIDKNNLSLGLETIQQAITVFIPNYQNKDSSLPYSTLSVFPDINIPDALNIQAKIYFLSYMYNKDIINLKLSLNSINQSWFVIDKIRKGYKDEESQIILNNNARVTVDLGLQVSLHLYEETNNPEYLREAFGFSEKGKAIILLGALRGLEARTTKAIPSEILKEEKNLNSEIAFYNNQVYEEKKKKSPDQEKLSRWNDQLFNYRNKYDSLIAHIKDSYPDYYGLKFDYSIQDVQTIPDLLDPDQVLISYHIADTTVFGFFIDQDTFYVKELGNRKSLVDMVDQLRNNFTAKEFFDADQEDFNRFTGISAALYRSLIKPFNPDLQNKRLLIIPDGELGYLPFDLLLVNEPDFSGISYGSLDWLIKHHPISYASSATVYFESQMKSKKQNKRNRLLAFAPSYEFPGTYRSAGNEMDSALSVLSPIKGTREEINLISSYFSTRKFFDERATESVFKEKAGDYSLLHLAMHTIIDDQNPLYSKLVFTITPEPANEDGFLNTYELFNLEMQGELAVLSACNTGTGKLERGEGIISLARGFFYAGIPSVVMTLWEVEDHSSAELMGLFYKYLQKGLPKDVALQSAKIEYLDKAGKLQSHPYFWAGFVNIGSSSPIVKYRMATYKILLFTGIAIIILLLVYYLVINKRVYFKKKAL